ncbi:MAG: M1 family aminopeptidase [Ferruginibacter sp.]|nr:M1 family aminopeptidase [Ferruginibacter sp.]
MFWQIFLFEIKYRTTRPASWIYFFLFFLIGFLSVATGSTPATEKVMHNAPWVMADGNIIFSMVGMLVCSAIMGVPLYRDIEHQTRNYFYAYPISKGGYFWGRFLGSFIFVLIVGSAFSWGSLAGAAVGPTFGWVTAERIGSYGLWNYFHPYFTFCITNLLLSSTIFFALVSLTRNVKVIYSASILLLIGYLLANFLVSDLERRELVKLLDPFALNTFELETRFYTPYEKNTLLAPISRVVILNRIIWLTVAAAIIGFAYWRFSFQKFLQPEHSGKKKKKKELAETAPQLPKLIHQVYDKKQTFGIWANLAKLEFLNIVKDNYFRAILGGGVVFLLIDFWIGNTLYSVGNKPLTVFLMEFKNYNYSLFIFIILLFYTGEAVHRERNTRFNILNDALPVSNTVFFLSKLAGLFGVAFVLSNIPIVVGVLVQSLKGFTDYNFSIYFTEMYLLSLPSYIQMVLLCFAVHMIMNNKFGGHGVAMMIWITMFILRSFVRMDYNLLFYFYTPNYTWSDMNGIGHFLEPQNWFNFYWLMLGALLVTLAFLFFPRGVTGGFTERWRVAMQRFSGWPRLLTTLFFVAWIGSGAFIYYNVSYLNNYYTAAETRNRLARYELALKKYEALPQPKVTSLLLKADIFPDDRRVEINARLGLKNKTSSAINVLHLLAEQNVSYSILYNGKKLAYTNPLAVPYSVFTMFKKGKDTLNYRIYQLPAPLQVGDTALLEVSSTVANHGFPNSGYGREILYNGTFLSGGIPALGYDAQRELESDEYRKQNGLKAKIDEYPEQDDPVGKHTILFNNDADLIHFEAVLSTKEGQIAIAPGYLQKRWKENGREYFSYVQDSPIDYFFSIVSARYSLLKDSVTTPDGKNINIEIFYDHQHPFNLDRFVAAYKDGLDYFSRAYGPFQHRQMRILEFPRYAGFAQSFPNTVPFSESFGWVADFKKPDDFDYLYFVTAHELAHQWWGHQVNPNYTRGSNLISEALAEYTALLLTERKYGKDNMKRFLKDELDRYLSGRANEAKKENVFLYCNRPYQWYNKGSLVIYGLRDLIGDSTLNKALHEFRDSFALKENGPFAGSNDLYGFLKKHTPDSFHYYLTDTWEKITLYENKLVKAVAKSTGKDSYDVTLDFSSKKWYADSSGKESPAAMNDYIDVAVFGEETRDKSGRKQVNPLYLQKLKLTPGVRKITLQVKGKPVKAGIDPYNKLIDRIPDDNMGDVDL